MTSNQSGAPVRIAPGAMAGSATVAPAEASGPQPHRGSLGLVQGTALYIASVLGTGILVLPGLAAAAAGPASIVAVAAVLVLSIPLAGTFAALASRYPDAGGVASFVRRALGGTAARMAGYWFFFGVCVGAPVLAILGGEYVVAVLGVDRAAVPIIGFAIFVPPFITNWFGVRVAGWVQFVLTGLLIAVVVGVVAVTFPAVDTSNFTPFLPNGWGGVGIAISLFVWAFAGWEVGTHISGEFRNPRRTIPLATAIAVVVVGAGYLALQFVTVAVLGDSAGDGQVPLLDLVETTAPGIGTVLVAVVAAIVTLGVMNAYLPAFGKLGAALGRDGDLPRFFAKGAADGEIPRRALALTGVLIIVYFALMLLNGLDLTAFILIHTSNMVAIYAAGMLAATLLLRRWSFGWWLAVVATIMTAGLLVLAWANLLVPLVLAAAAVAVTIVRRIRAGRRGVGSDATDVAGVDGSHSAPVRMPHAAGRSSVADHGSPVVASASVRQPATPSRPVTATATTAEDTE